MDRPWLRNWPEGKPISVRYPEIPLFEILRNTTRRYPERSAIIFYDKKITYRELDVLTEKFATALKDMGVKKGDRVALFLPNIPQFVIGYYGILKAGAVVTAISPLHEEREIEHELRDSGAKTVVALDLLYSKKMKTIAEKINLNNVIVTSVTDYLSPLRRLLAPLKGFRAETIPGTSKFLDLVKKHESDPSPMAINPREDLAVLQYTGGTTGTPKGVMMTHYNLVANAMQTYHLARGWRRGEKRQQDGTPSVLCLIPFFHIYGMTVAMNEGIISGSTLILIPQFDVQTLLKAIVKYKPQYFPGTPVMYVTLLNNLGAKKYDFTFLHYCASGGAPVPVEVIEQFMEVTGAELVEGYGLTEAGPVTHCNPVERAKRRPGSIGIPFPDTDAKIVDLWSGDKDLLPNEVGELVVRGPQVMKGYWNRPEETNNALRDGWLYTGDIARMDEDGYFYILDRKKDVLVVSGFRVLPSEIEEALRKHPAVKEAAVVGTPDALRCATNVQAFVVLKKDYEGKVTTDDLVKFCEGALTIHKVPNLIEFRKELPKTPGGKIFRRALREAIIASE